MVKLTKKQLEESIKEELKEENGLNSILKMTLESLMLLEREELTSTDTSNKGNGYRSRNSIGFGSKFRLSVLRYILGLFKSFDIPL